MFRFVSVGTLYMQLCCARFNYTRGTDVPSNKQHCKDRAAAGNLQASFSTYLTWAPRYGIKVHASLAALPVTSPHTHFASVFAVKYLFLTFVYSILINNSPSRRK